MTNILALLGDVSHVDIVNVTGWGGSKQNIFSGGFTHGNLEPQRDFLGVLYYCVEVGQRPQ